MHAWKAAKMPHDDPGCINVRSQVIAAVKRTPLERKALRKRLRKKQHLGEFQQLGFEVRFRVGKSVPDAGLDEFWDCFIGEAIEANGLLCGGGCGREWDVLISPEGRGSATEEHRDLIQKWLQDRADVENVRIGWLMDMWHAA